MHKAIVFWLDEYGRKYYVRFVIVDGKSGYAIGMLEMFTRKTGDIGILRNPRPSWAAAPFYRQAADHEL